MSIFRLDTIHRSTLRRPAWTTHSSRRSSMAPPSPSDNTAPFSSSACRWSIFNATNFDGSSVSCRKSSVEVMSLSSAGRTLSSSSYVSAQCKGGRNAMLAGRKLEASREDKKAFKRPVKRLRTREPQSPGTAPARQRLYARVPSPAVSTRPRRAYPSDRSSEMTRAQGEKIQSLRLPPPAAPRLTSSHPPRYG